MGTLTLLLAIHNHQPDGNFDEVFVSGYDDCYARILSALEEAPHVKVALHHTGPLLEWLAEKRPEYLGRMRGLVERGQVEVLGGGFYEPMLAVLPERDARGQIAMMADFAEARFGVRPEGMWLAERVWEPSMPALLASAGVRFTLIDDGHFRYAGETGALQGYYATEKAGQTIAIFPIDQKLRYAIPFLQPWETIDTLRSLARQFDGQHGDRDVVVTYGDDGEKFGMWPGTKAWVWDRGWLREFFGRLGDVQHEIRTGHFGEVLRSTPPSGRVYLPTASYEEMGEWALPAGAQERYGDVRKGLEAHGQLDAARAFLRGGIWQGFLARYPEANHMHKRMLLVSEKVDAAIARAPSHRDENALMTTELYRAQCNCSYWHGLFGGLYLNNLRDAVYRHLLVAESFADAALGHPAPAWATGRPEEMPHETIIPALRIEEHDLDCDLEPEVLIQTPALDVTVRPHEGGAVQELAYRLKSFMLTNVLSRRPEGYHRKLREAESGHAGGGSAPKSIHDQVKVKEPGLLSHLVYDSYTRYSFIDHVVPRDAQLEAFRRGEQREISDFPRARFGRGVPRPGEALRLVRDGWIDGRRARVEKGYALDGEGGSALTVRWSISVEGDPAKVLFGSELSLTLLDGRSQERRYEVPGWELPPHERELASAGAWHDVPSLSLVNAANGFRVDLDFGGARPSVWRFPLETVNMSEGGFERTFQGSVIMPLFALSIGRDPVELSMRVQVRNL